MNLTEAQQTIIGLSAPALQILACAGSGKTEVLARRTVRYLLEGAPPETIVAFTFTEKAAGELKDRIERRAAEADARFAELPPSASGMFVGTIHSYCLRVLQQYGGHYEAYEPLTEEREWALLHRFARRLGMVDLMEQAWPGAPVSVRRAVEVFRRSMAVVCNERILPQVLAQRTPGFAEVLRRYRELLSGMRLLSFDEMIDSACEELRPGGRLRSVLDGKLGEVLVDEYQDLNRAQEELLQRFLEMGARLTVVGDDDQAIYQWRGGDVSLFLRFVERYDSAQRHELAENHRSLPAIVHTAAGFAESIHERVCKAMSPARAEECPAVEMMAAGTVEAEAEALTRRICTLIQNGHRPADIVMLFRSVRTSARPFVEALRRAGVRVALIGKLSLLDRPEMALLARIFVLWAGGTWYPDEAQEVVTPERLARDIVDLTGVSDVDATHIVGKLERMGEELRATEVRDLVGTYLTMVQLIGLPIDGPERARQEQGLGRLSELLADFEHAQRRLIPAGLFAQPQPSAAEETAEDNLLLAEAEAAPSIRMERTRGEVFLVRLRVFLEEFAAQAAEEAPDRPTLDEGAVNVMTVHQSKGLEFPIVFVPCLVERRFPSARMRQAQRWHIPDDLFDRARYEGREDDERRLLYVAMTRAQELLVLSWFTQYSSGPATPSRFLQDLMPARQHLAHPGMCTPTVRPRPEGGEAVIDTDFAALLTFSECPYRYRLRYVCGFQPPIDPALGFGRLLHHTVAELARLGQRGRAPTTEDVEEILQRSFYLPFAGLGSRERLYRSARQRLRKYVRRYGEELVRTAEPERRFEVPLEAARVRGRIDLVLSADGGSREVELIDFKTAVNRPPSEHHKNQLRVYAAAMRTLGYRPVRLWIHDLDSDESRRVLVEEDERQAAQFRGLMQSWIDGIRGGEFPRVKDRAACRGCDFTRLCPRPFE